MKVACGPSMLYTIANENYPFLFPVQLAIPSKHYKYQLLQCLPLSRRKRVFIWHCLLIFFQAGKVWSILTSGISYPWENVLHDHSTISALPFSAMEQLLVQHFLKGMGQLKHECLGDFLFLSQIFAWRA